jgi:DNA end-binding protein Ku
VPKPKSSHAHRGKKNGEQRTGPRPTWSGALSFGLVTIPVELFPASRPAGHRAHMLDTDGTQLVRRYYCPKDGEDLDDSVIVRGYELPNGKYVVVSDEELEALAPKKSREIDLRLFTERGALHPALFEQAYVLAPTSDANKAYRLLADVMYRKERAGIATFVLREREYIIAIVSDGRWLFGQTMRFADELHSAEALSLPEPGKPSKELLTRCKRALAAVSGKAFDPTELVDPGRLQLEKLLEKKRKQGQVIAKPESGGDDAGTGGAEIIDLMERLKQSLQQKAEPAKSRAGAAAHPRKRKAAR